MAYRVNNTGDRIFDTPSRQGDLTGRGFGPDLTSLTRGNINPIGNQAQLPTQGYFNDLYNYRRTGGYDPRLGYLNAYPYGYTMGSAPNYVSPYVAQECNGFAGCRSYGNNNDCKACVGRSGGSGFCAGNVCNRPGYGGAYPGAYGGAYRGAYGGAYPGAYGAYPGAY